MQIGEEQVKQFADIYICIYIGIYIYVYIYIYKYIYFIRNTPKTINANK